MFSTLVQVGVTQVIPLKQSIKLCPALLSVNETSIYIAKCKRLITPLSSSEDRSAALLGACVWNGLGCGNNVGCEAEGPAFKS